MSSNRRKSYSSYVWYHLTTYLVVCKERLTSLLSTASTGVPYTDKNPGAQTWMYADEARRQQASVELENLLKGKGKSKYPSNFGNRGNKVSLSTNGSAGRNDTPISKHHPLIPGKDKAWTGGDPGAVRSVWTDGNPQTFDVIVHDKSRGLT